MSRSSTTQAANVDKQLHIANHGYEETCLHVAILGFFMLNFQYFVHWLGLGKDHVLA